MSGVPAEMPIENKRKSLGYRPVDPCLSRRVSHALFFPDSKGSLHGNFDGFGSSEEHVALLLLALQEKQHKEATVTVLTVSSAMAVMVRTATPLQLNPPFPTS